MNNKEYFEINKSNIKEYDNIELFIKSENKFTLYKKSGQSLAGKSLDTLVLYMSSDDKKSYLFKRHTDFNTNLKQYISHGQHDKIKEELYRIMDDVLQIHDQQTIQGLQETVDIFVDELSNDVNYIEALINFSNKDYSTTIHSINTMAFMLEFCYKMGVDPKKTAQMALGAMLHDLGKIYIDDEILKKRYSLSDEEYVQMKTHVSHGADILKKLNVTPNVVRCCNEHHERLDGSGYPAGVSRISPEGQLMGLIDCYEALISHSRYYKRGLSPYEAAEIINKDVDQGKWNKTMFEFFINTRLKKEY